MNWKELVGAVAPVLGTALGGPFGGVAGKYLAEKLGVPESDLESKILDATPEVMLQIKTLEQDFKVKMKELGIREQELDVTDRNSARTLASATSIYPQVAQSLVFDITFIFICYLLLTTETTFSESTQTIITYLMGILSTGLVQVNNFWFGSSSGSKSKTTLSGK